MTYNIMHGLDYTKLHYNKERLVNLEKVKDIILKYDVDIVNINEIYGSAIIEDNEFFNQVESLAKLLGFPYYNFSKAIDSKHGEYGNALFSKLPFTSTDYKIEDPITRDDDAYYESRVLTKNTFDTFTVFNTHFGMAKQEEVNAYKCFDENKTIDNTILMGDFNITPDNDIIKSLLKEYNEVTYLKNNEWINTAYSFDLKEKIDYIFASKDIEVLDAKVIDYIYSDHLPVYAEIKIGEIK